MNQEKTGTKIVTTLQELLHWDQFCKNMGWPRPDLKKTELIKGEYN